MSAVRSLRWRKQQRSAGWMQTRIKAAIEMYLENAPSGICLGVATDQTPNSVQAAMAADTIDFLMGNLEKPGALMQRFRTSGVLKVPNYPVPVALKCLPPEQLKKRLGGRRAQGLKYLVCRTSGQRAERDPDRETVSAADVDRPFR